jgi:hypothetical protein
MSVPSPHDQPDNAGVLRYLGQGADPAEVAIERPAEQTDRWRLGAHPDVVERLWTTLAAVLAPDSPRLIARGAALINPRSGQIIAVALGTTYAIRLVGDGLAAALARGYETVHEYRTVGRTLDLATTFGPGWVFGRHESDEAAWLAAAASDGN